MPKVQCDMCNGTGCMGTSFHERYGDVDHDCTYCEDGEIELTEEEYARHLEYQAKKAEMLAKPAKVERDPADEAEELSERNREADMERGFEYHGYNDIPF